MQHGHHPSEGVQLRKLYQDLVQLRLQALDGLLDLGCAPALHDLSSGLRFRFSVPSGLSKVRTSGKSPSTGMARGGRGEGSG